MSRSLRTTALLALLRLLVGACGLSNATQEAAPAKDVAELPAQGTASAQVEPTAPTGIEPPGSLPSNLIHPDDVVYRGAFRLPEGSSGSNWEYSGYAMTCYPEGDTGGPDDGYPGSIFGLGHDHQQYVSEITIPAPIISPGRNLDELNTADTLQEFGDITGGLFGELEIPRAGLEYLPPQGSQETGKLHFCWGQHLQFELVPSHGWSELDLASPQTAGTWYLSDHPNHITNDYLFEIPQAWADANTPGLRLATGRFRDGTWSGLGPALLAYGPWTEGDPPATNATLQAVTVLLLYGIPVSGNPEISVSQEMRMTTFSEPDEWSGGAWLTAGDRSAVIFAGTKATGRSWHGFANGVEYPTDGDPDEEVPDVPPWPYDSRGWWSEDIAAQIIFFNPDDLAQVARGAMESWEPQPYASLEIDDYLFDPGFDHERAKRYPVGAISFDRERGLLYLFERRADEEKSLVHVFGIEG